MGNLNSVLIDGTLANEPCMKILPLKIEFCEFVIEVNEPIEIDDKIIDNPSFFEVEVWGQLAVKCFSYLHNNKDQAVRVVGRLKQNCWHDSDDVKYSKVTIIADHIEFKPIDQNNKVE